MFPKLEQNSDINTWFFSETGWNQCREAWTVKSFLELASDTARNGGIVLDVGAGQKRYARIFDKNKYIALEHPLAGVENKNLSEFDLLGAADDIPMDNSSVDVILSTSALEHYDNPTGFASEAYRVLKTDGRAFIQVPFIYEEHEIPYDFQRYTRYGLEKLLRDAGFSEFEIQPLSNSSSSMVALNSWAWCDEIAPYLKSQITVRGRYSPKYIFHYLMYRIVNRYFGWLGETIPVTEKTTAPIGWLVIAKK